MEDDTYIAQRVEEVRQYIRSRDPDAYSGFITDAAIRIVARDFNGDWRRVLRAYRQEYPLPSKHFVRVLPRNARKPTVQVVEAAKNLFRPPPTCPHCGSVAPYGDARIVWIEAHLQNRPHRWWYKLKK